MSVDYFLSYSTTSYGRPSSWQCCNTKSYRASACATARRSKIGWLHGHRWIFCTQLSLVGYLVVLKTLVEGDANIVCVLPQNIASLKAFPPSSSLGLRIAPEATRTWKTSKFPGMIVINNDVSPYLSFDSMSAPLLMSSCTIRVLP